MTLGSLSPHESADTSSYKLVLAGCGIPNDLVYMLRLIVDHCPIMQVAQVRMSPRTFKVLTSLIRTMNNLLGGISFVVLAKVTGVQSSQGDEKKDVEKAGSR